MQQIAIGIDIGSREISAAVTVLNKNNEKKRYKSKTFENNPIGYSKLLTWLKSLNIDLRKANFLMEASGVYHQRLAFYLYSLGYNVYVLQPYSIKQYIKFKNVHTKTDKIDAQILSNLWFDYSGFKQWSPGEKIYMYLKQLLRTRSQLVKHRSMLKNQYHANQFSYVQVPETLQAQQDSIKALTEQIEAIEQTALRVAKREKWLWDRLQYLMSIKGVNFLTAITVVAETEGFANFRNAKKVVKYAGLDVVVIQSGMRKGKSHISKKGNKYIRHILFNAAMSFARFSQTGKRFYERIKARKGESVVAFIALARKLLVIMYALWKKQEYFEDNYDWHAVHRAKKDPANSAGILLKNNYNSLDVLNIKYYIIISENDSNSTKKNTNKVYDKILT